MILSKIEIAEAFKVSTVTIDEWTKDGFPVKTSGKKGVKNEYDLAECVEWRIESKLGKLDYNEQRTRLTAAQAEKQEIELQLLKGESVRKDDILNEFTKVLREFRSQLLTIPTRAATALQGIEEFADRKDIIENYLYEVLDRFANNGITDNNRIAEKSISPAKAKSKRVG